MHGQIRIARAFKWSAAALAAALLVSVMFATMTAEAQTGTATPTPTASPTATGTATGTPAPPATGNAGLADAEGSSATTMLLLVGGLVVGSAVAVAGARALGQRSR